MNDEIVNNILYQSRAFAACRMAAPAHPFVIEPPLTPRIDDLSVRYRFRFQPAAPGINRLLRYFIYAFDRDGKDQYQKR